MEVVLLGTGSADGWPNPFCTCASCNAARDAGEVRGQTSALVDGQVLIDCGPEAPRAAVRQGRRLDPVHTMLFTHSHPDHLGPMAFLFRHWAHRTEPLLVVGPPAVLADCEPWIGPDDPVTLRPVAPGDVVGHRGYTFRALAARHGGSEIGPAVLYDLTNPEGKRLFYASDTGPLPESTNRAVCDAAFDVALIEETFGDSTDHATGHLDLTTFPKTVARLRRDRAVIDSTEVVAIHLSHDNPPTPELERRLAACGVRVYPDGTVVRSGGSAALAEPPRRTLVLGGARSGKSAYAERLLLDQAAVTYVATSDAQSNDDEWRERVRAHRASRPKHWTTLETTDLVGVLTRADPGQVLLIDCLTLWLTRLLDETNAWDGDLSLAERRMAELVRAWAVTSARVIAVSNEVGSGVVPATASGRVFRDLQGRLNASLAAGSEEVTLLVAGRAVPISR